jgi:hypothetical protein
VRLALDSKARRLLSPLSVGLRLNVSGAVFVMRRGTLLCELTRTASRHREAMKTTATIVRLESEGTPVLL